MSYQLALYDSLYIALALNLNCPLVTVDERQGNGAIASGVILKAIIILFILLVSIFTTH
ncbi:MAG: hypothetical protein ACLGGO_10565 [Coleofasciculus sp.]